MQKEIDYEELKRLSKKFCKGCKRKRECIAYPFCIQECYRQQKMIRYLR